MTNEDELRQKFEALCFPRWGGDRGATKRREDGEYELGPLQFAWVAFLWGATLVQAEGQPKQEPVAWVERDGDLVWHNREAAIGRNLYITPQPAAPAVPLTREQVVDLVRESDLDWARGFSFESDETNRYEDLARAIERAHGIGAAAPKVKP